VSVASGGEIGLSMLSFSWKEAEINQGIIFLMYHFSMVTLLPFKLSII
jgi:hypothetical protein